MAGGLKVGVTTRSMWKQVRLPTTLIENQQRNCVCVCACVRACACVCVGGGGVQCVSVTTISIHGFHGGATLLLWVGLASSLIEDGGNSPRRHF